MSTSLPTAAPPEQHFTIEGVLNGHTVWARWSAGRVEGDPALLAGADAVIAAGCTSDEDPTVRASWDTLAGTAIALVRAVEQVTSAQVCLGLPAAAGLSYA